jgi:hypothetical protein
LPNAGPGSTRNQRELFKQYLGTKADVTGVNELAGGVFLVDRRGMSSLRVLLVDIYTVSESDVVELLSADPEASAIVTASVWNGVTPQAKELGRSSGVGVFGWREFMKAVHRDGEQFLAF